MERLNLKGQMQGITYNIAKCTLNHHLLKQVGWLPTESRLKGGTRPKGWSGPEEQMLKLSG
jgi:hypothetical protein